METGAQKNRSTYWTTSVCLYERIVKRTDNTRLAEGLNAETVSSYNAMQAHLPVRRDVENSKHLIELRVLYLDLNLFLERPFLHTGEDEPLRGHLL